VPLGGKYRLIDIPISNAINSGFRHIAVLTQFNSASLNNHIFNTYRFDNFGQGAVEVLAAEQTEEGEEWYQGTADAVRKQIRRLTAAGVEHVLILSGDHLYRMDYRELVERHFDTGADATVCVLPAPKHEVHAFGLLSTDQEGRIVAFREKPKKDEDISAFVPPDSLKARWAMGGDEYLVSMGVYIFKVEVLRQMLQDPKVVDFGKDILPGMLESHRVFAHFFRGYWRDIGTIGSFYEANLALTEENPVFRFNDPDSPIYTRSRFLPASKFADVSIRQSSVTEGCLVLGASIERSVVGIRSRIQKGAVVRDSILLGADYYESDEVRALNLERGIPAVGVGPGALIERAIVDKNARIGEGAVIRGAVGRKDEDGPGWFVRDGIVIISKDGIILPGTVI
jgi:glucose-1-phosphate adenylyltransferase